MSDGWYLLFAFVIVWTRYVVPGVGLHPVVTRTSFAATSLTGFVAAISELRWLHVRHYALLPDGGWWHWLQLVVYAALGLLYLYGCLVKNSFLTSSPDQKYYDRQLRHMERELEKVLPTSRKRE